MRQTQETFTLKRTSKDGKRQRDGGKYTSTLDNYRDGEMKRYYYKRIGPVVFAIAEEFVDWIEKRLSWANEQQATRTGEHNPDNNFHGRTFCPKYSTKHPPATLIIAFESSDRAEGRYQRYFPVPKSPQEPREGGIFPFFPELLKRYCGHPRTWQQQKKKKKKIAKPELVRTQNIGRQQP